MGYRDYYWGLCRDYRKDPFPHSLLRTRQSCLTTRRSSQIQNLSTPVRLSILKTKFKVLNHIKPKALRMEV